MTGRKNNVIDLEGERRSRSLGPDLIDNRATMIATALRLRREAMAREARMRKLVEWRDRMLAEEEARGPRAGGGFPYGRGSAKTGGTDDD